VQARAEARELVPMAVWKWSTLYTKLHDADGPVQLVRTQPRRDSERPFCLQQGRSYRFVVGIGSGTTSSFFKGSHKLKTKHKVFFTSDLQNKSFSSCGVKVSRKPNRILHSNSPASSNVAASPCFGEDSGRVVVLWDLDNVRMKRSEECSRALISSLFSTAAAFLPDIDMQQLDDKCPSSKFISVHAYANMTTVEGEWFCTQGVALLEEFGVRLHVMPVLDQAVDNQIRQDVQHALIQLESTSYRSTVILVSKDLGFQPMLLQIRQCGIQTAVVLPVNYKKHVITLQGGGSTAKLAYAADAAIAIDLVSQQVVGVICWGSTDATPDGQSSHLRQKTRLRELLSEPPKNPRWLPRP